MSDEIVRAQHNAWADGYSQGWADGIFDALADRARRNATPPKLNPYPSIPQEPTTSTTNPKEN